MKSKTRRRAKVFTAPRTETASVEVLIRRVDKLQLENARLTAKLEATQPADPLLVRTTAALQLARLATDSRRSTPTDGDRRKSTETPTPGDNVRGALRAQRALHQHIGRALTQFERAAEHHWYPPKPKRDPQVRCRNRQCEADRIPKYVGSPGTRIELIRCPSCDAKLTEA